MKKSISKAYIVCVVAIQGILFGVNARDTYEDSGRFLNECWLGW